jgi:hypothetical protein
LVVGLNWTQKTKTVWAAKGQDLFTICRLDHYVSCPEFDEVSQEVELPLWSGGQSSWVRFPALPDFLRSSGSGTGSNESREYN